MKLLLLNIVLAVLWVLLWGELNLYIALVGLVGGFVILQVATKVSHVRTPADAYGRQVGRLGHFAVYFVKILVVANLQIAREILSPSWSMKPRFLRYDVGHLSVVEVTALSNAITLTPGTLVVDISPDGRWLYIHAMYAGDEAKARRDLDELRLRMEAEVFGHPVTDAHVAAGVKPVGNRAAAAAASRTQVGAGAA